MLDGAFAPWHVLIVGLLALVVFGSKRLPDSARAVGQAMRIFKAETRELGRPEPAATTATAPVTPAPTGPQLQPYVGQPVYDADGHPVTLPGPEPRG